MNNRLIFSILTVVALAGHAQDLRSKQNTKEITHHAKASMAVEDGLKGSHARKAVRQDSGTPEFPMFEEEVKKGGPDEIVSRAASAESEAETAIEMRAPRFATFESADANTVVNDPKWKMASRAAGMSVNTADTTGIVMYDPRAHMIRPVNAATLSPMTTFEWTAGDRVSQYFLWIGSCQDCTDLLEESQGRRLTRTVHLPIDGRLIYVTLFSQINGDWYWIDYQYRAWKNQPVPSRMISPSNGSTLNETETFAWDLGQGVDQIWLRIGTCEGCRDILDENQGLHTRRTIRIPLTGGRIYVRLFSRIGGDWWYDTYDYQAPSTCRAARTVRVNIINHLAYPVNVSVNGRVLGSAPAFETAGANVEVCSLTLSYSVVQPTLGGRTLGDPMGGVFNTIDNPIGTYNFPVDNIAGSNWFFAPRITNRTSQPLLIEVNGGLEAQNRCYCVAPAHAERVAIGYYRFFSNSNVRLFRSNSDYTGPYWYFGIDTTGAGESLVRYVQDKSGILNLTANTAP